VGVVGQERSRNSRGQVSEGFNLHERKQVTLGGGGDDEDSWPNRQDVHCRARRQSPAGSRGKILTGKRGKSARKSSSHRQRGNRSSDEFVVEPQADRAVLPEANLKLRKTHKCKGGGVSQLGAQRVRKSCLFPEKKSIEQRFMLKP